MPVGIRKELVCAALGAALVAGGAGAQGRIVGGEVAPHWSARLDAVLDSYHLAEWDTQALQREAQRDGRLSLPLPDGIVELRLEPYALRRPDMPRYVTEGATLRREQALEPQHYRGTVVGQPDSDVRLTLSPTLAMGYVRRGASYVFLEPLIHPGTERASVLLYRDVDIKPEAAVPFDQHDAPRVPRHLAGALAGLAATTSVPRVLELVTEVDGEFTQTHAGGSTATANTLVQGYVATFGGILQSQLSMSVRLMGQVASANPAGDPFDSTLYGHGPTRTGVGSDACTAFAGPGLWEQFRNLWNSDAGRSTMRRDMAVLYTGRDLRVCATQAKPTDGPLFGSAGVLGSVCRLPNEAYVIVEIYPTNSAGLLAHEVGHALGASHDPSSSQAACDANPTDPVACACSGNPIMCGVVSASASTYSTRSSNAIDTHFSSDTNGACVRPGVVAVDVPAGSIYDFSDPTPPGVAREETLVVRNVGGTDLLITNPSGVVGASACFQQVSALPSLIPPGGSAPLRVRLLCDTRGTHTASVAIQTDDPVTPVFGFSVRGSVEPGAVYDLRFAASYVPTAGAARTLRESREAHPTQVLRYFFDPNKGSFEEQPGYTCWRGLINPDFFKVSLRANGAITGCTFQASWDPTEFTCSQAVVDLFNQGREIVVNTDDVLTDHATGARCEWAYSTAGVLSEHVRYGQEHTMRVTFLVGQGRYVRRLRFTKGSLTTYVPVQRDTFVDEATPTLSYNSATPLLLSNAEGQRRYAFLAFDVNPLPGTPQSAALYVDVQGLFYGLGVWRQHATPAGVYWPDLTWAFWEALTGGDSALSGSLEFAPPGRAKVSLGSGVASGAHTFRLATDDAALTPAIGSRESASDRPWLVITTQP